MKTDLKINDKYETDAVGDEASNSSLELQTSEECNQKKDENENVKCIRPLTRNTLMMKIAVGAKITREYASH